MLKNPKLANIGKTINMVKQQQTVKKLCCFSIAAMSPYVSHGQCTKAPLSLFGAWEDPSPGSWDVLIGFFGFNILDHIEPKKDTVKYL